MEKSMRYLLILGLCFGFVFAEDDSNDESESKLRNFESSLEENKSDNDSSKNQTRCNSNDDEPLFFKIFRVISFLSSKSDNNSDSKSCKTHSTHKYVRRASTTGYASNYSHTFRREPVLTYQEYPFVNQTGGIFGNENGKSFLIIPKISTQIISSNLTGTQYGFEFFHRKFGFSAQYLRFSEDVQSGEYLSFTDINYNFHFTNYNRSEYTNSDWQGSIGIKSVHGEKDNFGIHFGVKYLYFTHPVHYGFSMGYSSMSGSNIFEFNPEISYHYERLELTCGYSFLSTSTEQLSGLKMSIGLWF
jgi:hypothetical protein